MQVIISLFLLIASVAQGVFIILFLQHNQPGLTNFPVLCLLGITYFALFCYVAFNRNMTQATVKLIGSTWLARLIALGASIALVFIALDNLVFDYFQAVTTSDPVIYTMLASWVSLLIAVSLSIIESFMVSSERLVKSLTTTIVAVLGVPVMMLINLITAPNPNSALTISNDVFVGGEGGYAIYRIPAMLVIPAGSVLADKTALAKDRIVVMAEARRDGALDTGVIDLVQKFSDDAGQTWSAQQVICQYIIGSLQGKCGNATPVFDSQSGKLVLAYNLSGILGNKPERHHTSHVMFSHDGGITWGNSQTIAVPNAVFGPGHGIQKQRAPFQHRLVIPYNTSVGRQGSSMAMFSDDNGHTWQQGQPLGSGNENELAETANGDLVMATRHNAPIGAPPTPNGRLFSQSVDGGQSWSKTRLDTNILTPICQASIIKANNSDGMYFLNPANAAARVQLTLRYSEDNGANWHKSMTIFPGPAGYSQLAQLSDDSVIMLYENGSLSYSQQISFAKVVF